MGTRPSKDPRRTWAPARGDELDFILCRLCRHPYKAITPTHLLWKHRLDSEAYAERFPKAPFMAPQTRRNLTESIIGVWERQGRHWTEERVVRAVTSLRSRGEALHALAVKSRLPDLFGAGIRLYGSWDEVLRAAGLEPDTVRRRKIWTEEALARFLRRAKQQGLLKYGARFRRSHGDVIQACGLARALKVGAPKKEGQECSCPILEKLSDHVKKKN